MANTTTTQVPAAINNFYDRTLLVRAVPLFLHTRYGQVRDLPANMSGVIKFRRYTNLTAVTTPLTEGVPPAGSQLAITDLTATIAQYGDFVTLTDFLLFTTLDPVLTETAELLGDEAGDTLDQVCRDIIVAGTTVQYASTAVSRITVAAAMNLGATEVKKAVRTLKTNKAKKIMRMVEPTTGIATQPINAAYIGIVHPNTTYDLKAATGWIPVEKYAAQQTVMEGEVGALDDVRFVESPNAKVFTGAGASGIDVYATMILGDQAYANSRISGQALRNIIQPLGSAGTADPLEQVTTSGWKATYVAKRLNETFMCRVEHAVSP